MKTILYLLTGFVAVTAIVCGMLLIRNPDGSALQLPLSVLRETSFQDFTIPGYVLLIAVGGSNFIAVMAIFLEQKKAWLAVLAGGTMTIGWICIEILLTQLFFWLQLVYLVDGISIALLAFQLKEVRHTQIV